MRAKRQAKKYAPHPPGLVLPATASALTCRRRQRDPEALQSPGGGDSGGVLPQTPEQKYRLIYLSADKIRVRYVPTADFTPAVARSIVQRLQERLGTVEVLLERVDEVPREKNGKFRAVICKLPAEERKPLRLAGR
jgi:hypothetical protein